MCVSSEEPRTRSERTGLTQRTPRHVVCGDLGALALQAQVETSSSLVGLHGGAEADEEEDEHPDELGGPEGDGRGVVVGHRPLDTAAGGLHERAGAEHGEGREEELSLIHI